MSGRPLLPALLAAGPAQAEARRLAAVVVYAAGDVKVTAPGAAARPAKVAENLYVGDTLETGADGQASVALIYGAELRVNALSALEFRHGPKTGFEEPLKVWVPSIAPSGMAFLTSDRYPGWQGSLFVGALKAQTLVRLTLDGGKVVGEERLLEDLRERIRDVRQGPDGWLYLVTDGRGGKVLRLER